MSNLYATLHTNRGDIKIELLPNHAPKTVNNFVGLAKGTAKYTTKNATGETQGPFYDGAIFHRVISGFMIQGGDPTGTGRGGPGYTFADEFHPELAFNKPYLLAMANAGPGTNGSQFFITVGPQPHLTFKHTIFGEVADQASRDVVDGIDRTSTDRFDRPSDDIVINSISIEDDSGRLRRPPDPAGHIRTPDPAGPTTFVERQDREISQVSTPPPPYPTQGPPGYPSSHAVCSWHPDRGTALTCTRCGRPACPECLTPASVGFHCRACVAEARATDQPHRERWPVPQWAKGRSCRWC